ncbi:MAG: DUF58 domain-containing protein [Pseudomonadota bacterium]
MNQWLQRRAKVTPPLTLAYRQIFILPTRFGWLLGLLMFGMLMGSLNFNNNLGLLTTFVVAGMALNSMLIAYRNLRGLEVVRCQSDRVFAGQDATLRISLRNTEDRRRPGVVFTGTDGHHEVDIEPMATAEADLPIATRQRGWLTVGRIGMQTTHPTGLFKAWAWFWAERPMLVWPEPAPMPPPLPSSQGDETGARLRREPEGETFYSLRSWRQGDPLHRIAWKASQRHQTLLAREFRSEEADHLDLDLAATGGRDLEERISILTAWLLQAAREGQTWSLTAGAQQLGPDRGESHLYRCLDTLAEL